MKIGVLVKQVPDTASKIRIREDARGIVTDDVKWIVNPYDEFALEEALRLKEKTGEGEVIAISLGPQRAQEALRTALAMGADRALHLDDGAFEGSDTLGIARAIAGAIRGENLDLLFAGKVAVDDDNLQLVQTLAEVLGWPHIQPIEHFEISADRKRAIGHRMVGGGTQEVLEVPLPAIFGCDKGLNEPRYASLPGIMKAKKKPLKAVALGETGLDANQVGKAGAQIQIEKLELPAERKAARILKGDTQEVVSQLINLLRNEAKVL